MIAGIGIDIVEIARLKRVGIERLMKRILTEKERCYVPEKEKRKLEYIAGRFAAKEAIAKALGTGIGADFAFYDVEITKDDRGAPKAVWGKPDGKPKIHVSISHSEHYATAMVILEQ